MNISFRRFSESAVTKGKLIEILDYLGGRDVQQGMYFSVVVLQSYKSNLIFSRDPFFVSRVGRDGHGRLRYEALSLASVAALCTMGDRPQPANYRVARYQDVFRNLEYRAPEYLEFDDALVAYLEALTPAGRPH